MLIGVRADGRKELIALADGYRESAESWADLLRDCARRGMRAPVLAVGDGALGFWNGLREVLPETREDRRWFHKTGNVLAALPKSEHPGAKKALTEIWGESCWRSATTPRSTGCTCVRRTRESTFGDGPAPDQGHQRARLAGGGPGDGVQADQVLTGPLARGQRAHLVALVRAGAVFVNGKLVERPEEQAPSGSSQSPVAAGQKTAEAACCDDAALQFIPDGNQSGHHR
jgi:hypothetical protein